MEWFDGRKPTYYYTPYYRTLEEWDTVINAGLVNNVTNASDMLFAGLNSAIGAYTEKVYGESMFLGTLRGEKYSDLVKDEDENVANNFMERYWYRPVGYKARIDTDSLKPTNTTRAADWLELCEVVHRVIMDNTPKWAAMLYSAVVEYDPISNYSMVEEGLDVVDKGSDVVSDTGTVKTEGINSGTRKTDGTQTGSSNTSTKGNNGITTKTNGTETEIGQVAPYENETFLNRQKGTKTTDNTETTSGNTTGSSEGSSSVTTDSTVTTNGTDNTTQTLDTTSTTQYNETGSKSITLGDDTKSWSGHESTQHAFKRSGNIGVTTTQQMLESEIELKAKSIRNTIIEDVADKLMLHVW